MKLSVPMKLTIRMLLVLTGTGIFSGLILSQVSEWAQPRIEKNRSAALTQALRSVLPGGKEYRPVEDFPGTFIGYDNVGGMLGYAREINGGGFQGNIRLLFGLGPTLQDLKGIVILEQVETPGLGAKIVTPEFSEQFQNVLLVEPLRLVKGVAWQKPGEIQAITGATISSRAVVDLLNKGIVELREYLQIQTGNVPPNPESSLSSLPAKITEQVDNSPSPSTAQPAP